MTRPALGIARGYERMAVDKYHIAEIVAFLKARVPFTPEIAIVCGSGLARLGDSITDAIRIPYDSIPHFPLSTVAGHGTELVFGNLSGRKVVAQRGCVRLCAVGRSPHKWHTSGGLNKALQGCTPH